MKRKFRASNGKIYEIDDSQVNSFMKTFPDAVEVTEYSANGKVYEISNDQLPSFMKAFPDAFPEKKKRIYSTDNRGGNTPSRNWLSRYANAFAKACRTFREEIKGK